MASRLLKLAALLLMACTATAPAGALDPQRPATLLPSVVERIIRATVRIDSGSDRSSGVLISDRGHVLSVAHGLRAEGQQVTVFFSNGENAAATVRVYLPDTDVALLQLDPPEAMADRQPLTIAAFPLLPVQKGAVFSCGYPARERTGLSPVIRQGQIVGSSEQSLRTTCSLTAGDSGGPVTDPIGHLVGLNQKIGVGTASNVHLRIDVAMKALREFVTETTFQFAADRSTFPPLPSASPDVKAAFGKLSVTVHSTTGNRLAAGTVWNSSLVVTKLSLLDGDTSFVIHANDGTQYNAKLTRAMRSHDIALLSVADELPTDVNADLHSATVGQPVFASGSDTPGTVIQGMIARARHTESPHRPRIGLRLGDAADGSLVVTRVDANSAAADARIQESDVIKRLNQHSVRSFDDIRQALGTLQPGDLLQFEMIRDGEPYVGIGRLRPNPAGLLERSEFLDGRSGMLSHRRTGFTGVIQHDAALAPQDMGSPLLFADGSLAGVNIARRARESVLAVSASWLAHEVSVPEAD